MRTHAELLEIATRQVKDSSTRSYWGDPDRMTEEQLEATMKAQDEAEILRVFNQLAADEPMRWAREALRTRY